MKKCVALTEILCYNIYVRLRKGMIFMIEKIYYIYRGYRGDKPIATYYSMDQVTAFIQNSAAQRNHGFYRSWSLGGVDFYDCGDVVYKVVEKDFQENE